MGSTTNSVRNGKTRDGDGADVVDAMVLRHSDRSGHGPRRMRECDHANRLWRQRSWQRNGFRRK